jgi:hypothetical protein
MREDLRKFLAYQYKSTNTDSSVPLRADARRDAKILLELLEPCMLAAEEHTPDASRTSPILGMRP